MKRRGYCFKTLLYFYFMSEKDGKEQLLQKVLSEFNKNKPKKDEDEDDDQNFIKKDGEYINKLQEEVLADLADLEEHIEGILPESNQQRNLDRENGGLEAKAVSQKHDEDVWDKRGAEIQQMIEDEQDLNNASKSSRDQSFINRKKQEKRHAKKHKESAQDSFEDMGYVKRLRNMRQDRTEIGSPGIGGGRGM